jgi:hypothetical protein
MALPAGREFLDRESYWVWGRRFIFGVVEADATLRVELRPPFVRAAKALMPPEGTNS